jgi:DEAD/DEAH box helicase domain-containing protein
MDIGGVSADLHPATGQLTVFVYDGNAGGAGFAERGFAVAQAWLRATAEAIGSCECQAGCPSCVQSPKCGTGNEPLAKDGAVLLLETLLAGVPVASPAPVAARGPVPSPPEGPQASQVPQQSREPQRTAVKSPEIGVKGSASKGPAVRNGPFVTHS